MPGRDFSVTFQGLPAATPFGPAAGPHTQLAPNIVLAWLAGGRILELKTVQVNDRLTIPRPCIDVQNVGYNVEWSQELTLEESLDEYVKAALLIALLQPRLPGLEATVFDLSVGYDYAGITSPRVQAFLRGMTHAAPAFERLRREIPGLDADPPSRLAHTVTLSTFHGCPPAEIERIVDHLLRHHGLHCMIKLNPTLLGRAELLGLLHDRLGYTELRVPDHAFTQDTSWEQLTGIVDRLGTTAQSLGLSVGVKFTNTLIVANHRHVFQAPEMYLSGPPLHVLAMSLVRRFRRTFGDRFPISFSAGVDRVNFPDAVALGLAPVTVCTDLLKPGGYGRGHGYFAELARRMGEVGAATVDEFLIRAYEGDGRGGDESLIRSYQDTGRSAEHTAAPGPPPPTAAALVAAKLRNTELYVDRATADPRYTAAANRREPRKIGRKLWLHDCLTCDKCIPVCPNDAIFTYAEPGHAEPHQIGIHDEACNDCGNCDTFCPEDGGPNLYKLRVHVQPN